VRIKREIKQVLPFSLDTISEPLLKYISLRQPLVSRKLNIVIQQLGKAESTEEYQQIGIIIRDIWIETAQSLFKKEFVPEGIEIPAGASAKTARFMLQYTIKHWKSFPDDLHKLAIAAIDLSNKIQHKTNIDQIVVKWCLVASLFSISMLLDLDSTHDNLAYRTYYKCPKCGSIDLSYKRDTEASYDGPGPEFEHWICSDCDWEDYIYIE
jgi:hypothetical protein